MCTYICIHVLPIDIGASLDSRPLTAITDLYMYVCVYMNLNTYTYIHISVCI